MGLITAEPVLPSQIRMIKYTDKGIAALARKLEEAGMDPDRVAQYMEPAVDTALEIQDHVLYPAGTVVHTCWELASTTDWLGRWLSDGGPLSPVEGTSFTLMNYLPGGIVDCKGYFEQLAGMQERLGSQLRTAAKQMGEFSRWAEVMDAAADEARTKSDPKTGADLPDVLKELPWWVWAGGAVGVGWLGLGLVTKVGLARKAWRD